MNWFFLIILMISPTYAFADGGAEHHKLFGALIFIAYTVSFIGGMFALYKVVDGFRNFKTYAQKDEHFARKLAVRFFMAAVLLNPQLSIQMTTNTMFGGGGSETQHCYAYSIGVDDHAAFQTAAKKGADGQLGISDVGSSATTPQCYTTSTTSFVTKLNEQLTNRETALFDKLMATQVQFIVSIIQAIGVMFYLNAWFKIWAISEGTERQSTYKGQLIVIVMCSFIINLPKTAQLFINTYESFSF